MFQIFTTLADFFLQILQLDVREHWVKALHFFIEDTTKIFFLVLTMIYFISLLRYSINLDFVRTKLEGKSKWLGYLGGSFFGAITPFCSCSSIPLFLGFTAAKIPMGATLAFLITSPLVNEVALLLLLSILGIKFTIIYMMMGILIGILGGIFFDFLKSEKHLQPLTLLATETQLQKTIPIKNHKALFSIRHQFALKECKEILQRIWKWIFLGIGVGAFFHGFIPENWFVENLQNKVLSVPMGVLISVPLYSNASGMIPIIESLINKGLPVGTAMAIMMSTVGASIPEFLLLKEVLKAKLLCQLFIFFLVSFTLLGWLLNTVY